MSEASERDEAVARPGPDAVGADPGGAAPATHERPPDTRRGDSGASSHTRRHGRGATDADHNARRPTGLAASLIISGGMLLAMVEDVRMRGGTQPEDLRPLADTFARHCAAKEATVRKVLVRHGESARIVERDRQEGDLIQGILDRALTGRHPEDTRHLTIDGALAQMYQYLFHERRDLVPALERSVPFDESETLAAAFTAISEM
jgi:hypothetical protein